MPALLQANTKCLDRASCVLPETLCEPCCFFLVTFFILQKGRGELLWPWLKDSWYDPYLSSWTVYPPELLAHYPGYTHMCAHGRARTHACAVLLTALCPLLSPFFFAELGAPPFFFLISVLAFTIEYCKHHPAYLTLALEFLERSLTFIYSLSLHFFILVFHWQSGQCSLWAFHCIMEIEFSGA